MVRRLISSTEYRLLIPGLGFSFRSPRAPSYKARVRRIARSILRRPLSDPVHIRIDYFHTHRRRFDVDNLAKCILDALNGIAYRDDSQVLTQRSSAHFLGEIIHLVGIPIDLVKPLRTYAEYAVVRIKPSSA